MKTNPLRELAILGQSVWYDQMEKSLITKGTLKGLIASDDLRGLTSNPTIFEKAIGGSADYDEQLRALAEQGKNRDEIYEALVLEDIGNAADAFRQVYDKQGGDDGYVSLEVSPELARNTAGTIAEAKRLFETLSRPNVMIKIPATPEGIPAIEETIAGGINVNVTLIFSLEMYEKVMEAYLRGLERRVDAGLSIGYIASVASFFVSRIDTIIDNQIAARIAVASESEKPRLESLLGKIAIANARIAYQRFEKRFGGDRFEKLRQLGARVQRPLWASTGTKNPAYPDTLYIDALIARDTVNTIPPKTYEAFRDHGTAAAQTIEDGVEEAAESLRLLEESGISLATATEQLMSDGVESFAQSFRSLMDTIETRRQAEVVS